MKILILGGTKMARQLAENLADQYEITYSIAGATKAATLPKNCHQVSGGFGGTAGLLTYIKQQKLNLIIDATHPFAQNISRNAIAASTQANIPIIEYARQAWQIKTAQEFNTADQLITSLPKNAKIWLTIGSQNIEPFLKLTQPTIARMIEAPQLKNKNIPQNFKIQLSRPPYALAEEFKLIQKHNITHLICKNSGGNTLAAKLIAAQELGIKILMLSQPKSAHKIQFFNQPEIKTYLNNLSLVSPS